MFDSQIYPEKHIGWQKDCWSLPNFVFVKDCTADGFFPPSDMSVTHAGGSTSISCSTFDTLEDYEKCACLSDYPEDTYCVYNGESFASMKQDCEGSEVLHFDIRFFHQLCLIFEN